MSFLIPTFEYDLFISYRHNDNLPSLDSGRQASDGWVADFVQNLEQELRGTIKDVGLNIVSGARHLYLKK